MIEGSSVVLTATGTEPDDAALTFEWDLNLNGTYETSGQTVSFSAAALQAPRLMDGRRPRYRADRA